MAWTPAGACWGCRCWAVGWPAGQCLSSAPQHPHGRSAAPHRQVFAELLTLAGAHWACLCCPEGCPAGQHLIITASVSPPLINGAKGTSLKANPAFLCGVCIAQHLALSAESAHVGLQKGDEAIDLAQCCVQSGWPRVCCPKHLWAENTMLSTASRLCEWCLLDCMLLSIPLHGSCGHGTTTYAYCLQLTKSI